MANLAGKADSISIIYVFDIHRKYSNKNLTEKQTVWTGRVVIVVGFAITLVISPFLRTFGQAFE